MKVELGEKTKVKESEKLEHKKKFLIFQFTGNSI